MADIRVNGRRFPALQSVDTVGKLLVRLDAVGAQNKMCLTAMYLNGRQLDIDGETIQKLRLDVEDTVEARMESSEQLAFESLQVAQEMAELLVFDIKVATLHLWDGSKAQEKSLETLLNDCRLFLTLGVRPVDLLGHDLNALPKQGESCLRQLDSIAGHLEDATLLAVNGKQKDCCHVLIARVMPAIEKWLGYTAAFAEILQIDKIEVPVLAPEGQSASENSNVVNLPR